MEGYIGQIMLWPIGWAPNDWLACEGQELPIQQYTPLFSLIGIAYGGNGSTTFKLPDLRDRVPMGVSATNPMGKVQGATTSTATPIVSASLSLTVDNLPPHTHAATFTASGTSSKASVAIPVVANPNSTTTTPGTGVSLTRMATESGDNVTAYSSDPTGTTLRPFEVPIPAGGGTVTNASTGNGKAVPIQLTVPVTVSTLQPSLALRYIICVNGLYPDRP